MSEWTVEEQQKVMAEVVKKAATDAEFRARCFADPSGAIEEVAGKPVPEGHKIQFVDGSGYDVTLVLPGLVEESGELSDEDLEQVAGGGRCAASCAGSCAITSTATYGVPGVGGVACV